MGWVWNRPTALICMSYKATKAGTTPPVEKGVGIGQKTGIIKFSLMLISSDAEKQISLNFL